MLSGPFSVFRPYQEAALGGVRGKLGPEQQLTGQQPGDDTLVSQLLRVQVEVGVGPRSSCSTVC